MPESRSLAPLWKGLPSDPKAAAAGLLKAFLSGRKPSTLRTYQQGLQNFLQFLQASGVEAADPNQAAAFLLSRRHGEANKVAYDFKAWMIDSKFASATINNRLAALRALVKLGQIMGVVPWELQVQGVPNEAYRDTAGPGFDKIREKVRELEASTEPKAIRDAAIVALLGALGLRRGEAAALDIEDIDFEKKKLYYLGKGRTNYEPMSLPDRIVDLLKRWIAVRKVSKGPLFTNFDPAGKGERLTGKSIWRITTGYGLGRAHGLRHSAITHGLDREGGDIRKVAKFARHKNIQTTTKYDDNRKDLGGQVAKGIADDL